MAHVSSNLLADLPLYRGLGESERALLASVSRLRCYRHDETIFRENDPSEIFFVIVEGLVKLTKSMPEGREVILHILGPGDPLGAVAVYDELPYPGSAIVLEDATCVLIRRGDLFDLLERHPQLVRGLLKSLTRRLVELTGRLTELSGGHVEERLARLLLKMADDRGRPDDAGVLIPLALSRQELADLTGTTIETCIRIMSRWGKSGVVATRKDGFMVRDRAALEKLATR